MKSRLFNILLVSIFASIFLTLNDAAAQSTDRAMWVWSNTDEIITDFIEADSLSTSWDDFISFCEAPHGDSNDRILNIYMSAYSYMLSKPDEMRSFLADMSSRGFNVYVVLADPIFAIPLGYDPVRGANVRFDFEAKIDDIIIFQKNGSVNERFAGIMLDIEPHLNNDPGQGLNFYNPDHFPTIWAVYINDLTYCKSKIDIYNTQNNPDITFSDAVASWYSAPHDWDGDGVDEILMNDIMPLVSFYTVQAYRDSSAEIQNVAGAEIAEADNNNKVCIVGVETMNISSLNLTFWDEGYVALETALDDLASIYQDNDGFGGFYIHSYANGNIGEEGYQNLTPVGNDHAPVITITSPNGVDIEGIGFTNDFTVTWNAFVPDTSKNYNVEISYTFESQIDNDSSWTVIDTDSNISSSVVQSSSTFEAAGISTSNTDRIIIRARISYASGDTLLTYDKTNFGIAVNESPDPNVWANNIYLNYSGYPQGMKVISDDNNVLHAAYYVYYERTQDLPGVYYASSNNGGASWSAEYLTPDSYYYDQGHIQSTWPRRPSISKHGKTIAVAWVEDVIKDNEGFYDKVISLQINDNDGNSQNWITDPIMVSVLMYDTVTNVEVNVDANNDVHLVWEAYYHISQETRIEYTKYSYNETAGEWQTSGVKIVAQDNSGDYYFRSPSVTSTSYGIHAVWGEYKKTTTQSTPGSTIFDEDFSSYYSSNWAVYGANGGTQIIYESGNYYIKIHKDSSTARCGLYQKADWGPAEDLTDGFIAIDVKTNSAAPITAVVTAEIVTTTVEDSYFTTTFSLPASQYYDLPASSAGWQTLVFNVDDLTYAAQTWAHPRLDVVKQVKIRVEYTGAVNIDVDNFTAYEAGTVTVIDPQMRIVSRTKSASWEPEKEIYSQSYTNEQDYPRQITEISSLNYPLYFPKITSLGDYVYATWQLTTLGTPDNDGLDEFSSVYFSKCDVSLSSNNWSAAAQVSSSGYAPDISVWNNAGTTTIQLLYSDNFDEYIADEIYTGNLIYIESMNSGSTWSSPEYIAQGSGEASGIRRPYVNNSYSGNRAVHFMSYPFIFSDENGVSTMNWINGGQNGSGTITGVPEEYCKIRGTIFLIAPASPFADLSDNDGFAVKWSPPNIAYAPTSYKLRRIPDNNMDSIHYLNNGNPIYGLNFYDNEGIVSGVHYRYQLAYLVDSAVSEWSLGSNAVKSDIYLLLDDFEVDANNKSYTETGYFPSNSDVVGIRTNTTVYSGSRSFKMTYTHTEANGGSYLSLIFPTAMDFSRYGSLDLQVKFNPISGMNERIVMVQLVEDTTGESFTIGSPIMLKNDGQWHLHHQFLDQVSLEINGIPNATLDLDNIKMIRFVTWEVTNPDDPNYPDEQGNTSYFVDDIKLNNNPILVISEDSLTRTDPIYQRGFEQGFVINDANDPVSVVFGNGKVPWYLRIYTDSQITDNTNDEYDILKDGLIRYQSDNDTFYPVYNLPLKVWCKNFGPPGFYNDKGEIENDDYALNGYPPITNRYFFRGYDFNHDRKIAGLLTPAEGPFIESENDGNGFYKFDLDGDGFHEGDNFFTESAKRAIINEEPAWLFVPVLKHPAVVMDNDAIVMDPDDDITWRVLTDNVKGAGNHVIDMYFAVFLGTDQIMRTQDEHGYGEYKGNIIIDMLFN
ncbi:hypothetical protein J7L67_03320 [bacterium]|nr:hypothetical protein [bacterium]